MSTQDAAKGGAGAARQAAPKRRGWFRRNWRRFVLVLFLAVIAAGCVLYWNFFVRVYNLEVCQEAMKSIEADKSVQESLGQSIHPVWRPRSLFSKDDWQEIMPSTSPDELDIYWSIVGSKGRIARAQAHARLIQDKLQIMEIKVDDKGVPIQAAGNPEEEAPLFQPPQSEPPKTEQKPGTKGPEVNITPPTPPDNTR